MMNPSADKESSCIDPGGFRQASDPLIKLLSNQEERETRSREPYVYSLYWLNENFELRPRTNIQWH